MAISPELFARRGAHPQRDTVTSGEIESLQIGMHWFPERAGGVDRMYYTLTGALPGAGVRVRGLVAGSTRVTGDTAGAIRPFAAGDASLRTRLAGVRASASAMLRERRPDVLATHFALYTAPLLDTFRAVPTVIHFHGPWADESKMEGSGKVVQWLKHAVERAVYARGARYITLSHAFGDLLARRYRVQDDAIRVVPGCVDTAQFAIAQTRADARRVLGLPADRQVVVCVRRLVHRMGLEDLIDGALAVRERVPDALLVIAGKGPLDEPLRRRIAERGLAGHVRMLGFVPDALLPTLYRAADLSVVPSVALEGFGLTTIESLAAGTPVLVTPVGGLPEVVRPLAADLVLDSCGAAALAAGIGEALTGGRRVPGEAACRQYARERFDTSVIARQVAAVYREAIGAA